MTMTYPFPVQEMNLGQAGSGNRRNKGMGQAMVRRFTLSGASCSNDCALTAAGWAGGCCLRKTVSVRPQVCKL